MVGEAIEEMKVALGGLGIHVHCGLAARAVMRQTLVLETPGGPVSPQRAGRCVHISCLLYAASVEALDAPGEDLRRSAFLAGKSRPATSPEDPEAHPGNRLVAAGEWALNLLKRPAVALDFLAESAVRQLELPKSDIAAARGGSAGLLAQPIWEATQDRQANQHAIGAALGGGAVADWINRAVSGASLQPRLTRAMALLPSEVWSEGSGTLSRQVAELSKAAAPLPLSDPIWPPAINPNLPDGAHLLAASFREMLQAIWSEYRARDQFPPGPLEGEQSRVSRLLATVREQGPGRYLRVFPEGHPVISVEDRRLDVTLNDAASELAGLLHDMDTREHDWTPSGLSRLADLVPHLRALALRDGPANSAMPVKVVSAEDFGALFD